MIGEHEMKRLKEAKLGKLEGIRSLLTDKQREAWIAAGMPTDLHLIEDLLDHFENQNKEL